MIPPLDTDEGFQPSAPAFWMATMIVADSGAEHQFSWLRSALIDVVGEVHYLRGGRLRDKPVNAERGGGRRLSSAKSI